MVCPVYPAINIYSRPAKVMTALGPVCVATAVHDIPGWDAEVVDENNYRRGPIDAAGRPDHRALQRARPADVVGLYGGLTSTIPRLFDIARLYKGLGARTVAGGHHFVEDRRWGTSGMFVASPSSRTANSSEHRRESLLRPSTNFLSPISPSFATPR
jgi:hypothetical protein